MYQVTITPEQAPFFQSLGFEVTERQDRAGRMRIKLDARPRNPRLRSFYRAARDIVGTRSALTIEEFVQRLSKQPVGHKGKRLADSTIRVYLYDLHSRGALVDV